MVTSCLCEGGEMAAAFRLVTQVHDRAHAHTGNPANYQRLSLVGNSSWQSTTLTIAASTVISAPPRARQRSAPLTLRGEDPRWERD